MEEKVIFAPKTVKIKGGEILIRLLREEDGLQLALEEQAQGWGTTTEKFETRMRDFAAGACIPLCAELDGKPVGYVNLYKEPGGPFAGTGWPYIVDFAVLERVRGRGVGSALMDAVEALAAETSDTVCLGVGLHSGYGAAQRMYVLRGYVPDGSGVWYEGRVWDQYAPCVNDDELNLFLSKKLFDVLCGNLK